MDSIFEEVYENISDKKNEVIEKAYKYCILQSQEEEIKFTHLQRFMREQYNNKNVGNVKITII